MLNWFIGIYGDLFNMSKYRLRTPIKNLTTKELRDICKFGISFCGKELGVNNRHMNRLRYSILSKRKLLLGEYCFETNRIIIYKSSINNLGRFVYVFIHEYTHHLQPIKSKYHKMLYKFGYDKHPHEIEADRNSLRLYKKFLREYREYIK